MPALHEVQGRMAQALLGRGAFPQEWLLEDGLQPALRLAIHRTNMFVSLKEVLRQLFPAVCRVVDERFFHYATEEFIRLRPPRRAYLSAYGDEFACFLAEFAPCRQLPYLADLAHFEWLLHRAAHAESPAPLDATALASLPREQLPYLSLCFEPSFGYLHSPWPIDRIWRANAASEGESVNVGSGRSSLEIRRLDGTVIYRALSAGVFAFRQSLHQGCSLGAANSCAQAVDPSFDLAGALLHAFLEKSFVGFSVVPQEFRAS